MALLPLLIELSDELSHPSRNHLHSLGRGLLSHDLESLPSPFWSQYHTGYNRPCRFLSELRNPASSVGIPKSTIGKDGFQVCLDVQHFAPNEISVKTVDNDIVVEANHEERQDEHGYISRQFKRRYALPKGFDIKDVVTQLSSDGVLTIKAPPKAKSVEDGNVRVLQIQQTGPARLNASNKETAKPTEEKQTEAPKNSAKSKSCGGRKCSSFANSANWTSSTKCKQQRSRQTHRGKASRSTKEKKMALLPLLIELSDELSRPSINLEANHEERQDEHGYISRQFKRRFTLPKGFDIKDVVTQLSSDGVLTIKAPPKSKANFIPQLLINFHQTHLKG
ncbi:Heat shock protein 23, partial [Pseudolycoriella hygida]